jgi:hypothetical protein
MLAALISQADDAESILDIATRLANIATQPKPIRHVALSNRRPSRPPSRLRIRYNKIAISPVVANELASANPPRRIQPSLPKSQISPRLNAMFAGIATIPTMTGVRVS